MTTPDLADLAARLDDLRDVVAAAAESDTRTAAVHPDHRASAVNLVHFLALRQHDIRPLQAELADLGLSSLGRAEASVLTSIDQVRRAVTTLGGLPDRQIEPLPLDLARGDDLLERNAERLLGPVRRGRRTRIMVTLPSEAATDPALVERIVTPGAEVVRINGAHDDAAAWASMIEAVRAVDRRTGRRTTVSMDLAGPKLRTGAILPGPQVVRVRPTRDLLGRPVEPARVWLHAEGADGVAPEGVTDVARSVPVTDADWLAARTDGEDVDLTDARGSRRRLTVLETHQQGVVAEVRDTTYFLTGTELVAEDGTAAAVGDLPPVQQKLRLHVGDVLHLVPGDEPADPTATPPRIGCTLPEVFDGARVGHRVFFDDGKIGGEVVSATPEGLRIRITDAAPGGTRLAAAKGINLPDSALDVPALSEEDEETLRFVVEHADVVSLSFVRSADDVARLQERLAELGRPELGIILKVETVEGFERLPEILLRALRSPAVGVMIARGDLAVEAGYGRLGEVQEQIMWLCEAAHVPVVWATQVLDSLARTGHPSRAEVTDAAMSVRTECVMLNKGPYIDRAVAFLDDLLGRMGEHHHKKRSLLRRLRAWDGEDPEDELTTL